MEKNFPHELKNEKDLLYFEKFLQDSKTPRNMSPHNSPPDIKRHTVPESTKSSSFSLCDFLKDHIGKTVRVDFAIGNMRETKVGVLFKVGKEYIVLKPQGNNKTVICDINSIKFITVIHKI